MKTELLLFLTYACVFVCGIIVAYALRFLTRDKIGNTYKTPTMSANVIKNMIGNYRENQQAVINKHLGIRDADSVWFGLTTLKNFIGAIENETQKIDPRVAKKDLGVRFYYAAYPKEQDWEIIGAAPITKNYAERHTLIMIPTLRIEKENLHYDFNPLDRDTYSKNRKYDNQSMQKAMSITSSSETMAENHGGLIPPNDPEQQSY